MALSLIAVCVGCVSTTKAASVTPQTSAPSPVPSPAGIWQWSYESHSDVIRRVESERWQLAVEGEQLTGTLIRTVEFFALNGVPFACNHHDRYRLEAHYQLHGQRDRRGALSLREQDVWLRPSPCEPGTRTLLTYRGHIDDNGRLALRWSTGSQMLTRLAPIPTSPTPAYSPSSSSVRAMGHWQWRRQGSIDHSGQRRHEAEDWQLSEADDGVVTGTVIRTVTIENADRSVMSCSGTSSYQYRDRYAVRGRRQGQMLTLSETAVEAGRHPCLAYSRRHLDAAKGQLFGEYIELIWRGQRRQVLRRPELDARP